MPTSCGELRPENENTGWVNTEPVKGQIIGLEIEKREDEEEQLVQKENQPVQKADKDEMKEVQPSICGVDMKWFSLIALTFQTTGQALLIKWADAQGNKEYLASTVVFYTEVVKLITSILLVIYESSDLWTAIDSIKGHFMHSSRDLAKAAVPSLIYTVQNNLMFYSLTKLSAPVQQVLYQMKIVTTAGLGVLMLGKRLGPVKWSACFLLAFGIMVVQVSRNAQLSQSNFVLDIHFLDSLENDQMKGFGAVILACFTSGFAGVWIQKMLQQTSSSIWMRNVQLGLFGSFTGLLVAVVQDGKMISAKGFHAGYNTRVFLVIAMNAFGGLLCAVMLKYAGATHGCFSTALSIILTCVMSAILLQDFVPDLLFIVGTSISVCASFLFALGLPSRCTGGNDGLAPLAFGEFCEALRRLGYAGDFKSLFKDYDKQQKGFICLGDIDPEADLLVSDFLSLLGEHFGTLNLAWKDGFHQDMHGSVTKKEVIEVCSSLGYNHDAEKLFKHLSPQKTLSIWDLDPACSQKLQSGHNAVFSGATCDKKTFMEEGSLTSRSQKTFYSFINPSQLQQLQTALKRHFGSTVVAWRRAFDPANHGTCGFGIFMQALQECAFNGKAKVLWEELSGKRPHVTFHDVDDQAASLLESIREQFVEKFGSIIEAWYKLEESAGGLLDEESFIKSINSLAIAVKRPKKLFKLLLSWPPAQKTLVIEDFLALLIGAPLAEQAAELERLELAKQRNKPRKEESPKDAKQGPKASRRQRQKLQSETQPAPVTVARKVPEQQPVEPTVPTCVSFAKDAQAAAFLESALWFFF
eukprot:symbB.v1.2.033215.t1/scaffold4097.1/size44767/4